MANELQLDIVTPSASVYSGPASEVIIPAWDGEMGIYAAHDALLALLRAGTCVVTTPSGTQKYVVGRGFADIGGASVTLLTDSCERVEAIDKAQAQAKLADAEKKLGEALPLTEAHNQASIALELARARASA